MGGDLGRDVAAGGGGALAEPAADRLEQRARLMAGEALLERVDRGDHDVGVARAGQRPSTVAQRAVEATIIARAHGRPREPDERSRLLEALAGVVDRRDGVLGAAAGELLDGAVELLRGHAPE